MTSLSTLLPSHSQWKQLAAYGINDSGQITGIGNHKGQIHAFLMTPRGHSHEVCDMTRELLKQPHQAPQYLIGRIDRIGLSHSQEEMP